MNFNSKISLCALITALTASPLFAKSNEQAGKEIGKKFDETLENAHHIADKAKQKAEEKAEKAKRKAQEEIEKTKQELHKKINDA